VSLLSPLPRLDIFTVKVMTLVTVLTVTAATLIAWRSNPRVAGMRLFSLGLLSVSLGCLIGIARLVVSGDGIIIACNVFMFGGMIAVIQGIREFRGFAPLPRMLVVTLTTVVSIVYLYWIVVQNSFGARVGVISCGFGLLAIDAAASMFREVAAKDRRIYWPAGFAFTFAAVYMALRAGGALSGFYGANFLSPVPIELAATICASVAFIICAFGMLLASNAQLSFEAQRIALFDPLTNLPNRRLFLDRLLNAEETALATDGLVGIIYLDLDGFKLINDTLGHAAGDDLLGNVSAAMKGVLRSGDCLARVGGDEFVVLVEQLGSRDDLTVLAERLKEAVAEEPVPGDFAAPMRISCGIAVFPEDGRSAHDVMREADLAMYREKRRNRRLEMGLSSQSDRGTAGVPVEVKRSRRPLSLAG
jgi:diguanylate cyclase (GGDEF)-like protein